MNNLLATLIFASAIVSSDAMTRGAGIIPPTVPPAPVGHAQPTARSFTLNSAAAESERRRLSAFDAEQHKLDEMLDKKLNICRC
jgi:hypothetical protein